MKLPSSARTFIYLTRQVHYYRSARTDGPLREGAAHKVLNRNFRESEKESAFGCHGSWTFPAAGHSIHRILSVS